LRCEAIAQSAGWEGGNREERGEPSQRFGKSGVPDKMFKPSGLGKSIIEGMGGPDMTRSGKNIAQ